MLLPVLAQAGPNIAVALHEHCLLCHMFGTTGIVLGAGAGDGLDRFVDLQQQRYLPPDGTADALLDARFLVADTPDEAELLVRFLRLNATSNCIPHRMSFLRP